MQAQRDVRLIDPTRQGSITFLLDPIAKATGKPLYRQIRLKMLSHLIDRDVTSAKEVRGYEYERLMDLAFGGWREGDWTPKPSFTTLAAKLAAGYALVVAQTWVNPCAPRTTPKKKKHGRKHGQQRQQRRKQRVA